MILRKISHAALLASAAAFAFAAPAAVAQEAETMEAPAEAAPAPAANYDETKLKSFVVAFLQVDQINRTYAPQLQEAEGDEAQNAVREQASQQMVEAVESTDGITVEEYGTIIQQAQTDPALAQQINEYIQEAVGTPAEGAAPAGGEAPAPAPAPAE